MIGVPASRLAEGKRPRDVASLIPQDALAGLAKCDEVPDLRKVLQVVTLKGKVYWPTDSSLPAFAGGSFGRIQISFQSDTLCDLSAGFGLRPPACRVYFE